MPDFIVPAKKRGPSAYSKYKKRSGVFATPRGQIVSGSGGTRSSVIKAAEVVAEAARKRAARFSTRIPPATHVKGYEEQQAMIVTDGEAAPNAAPFEFGERHPDNLPNVEFNRHGRRKVWCKQPKRAYMSGAANSAAVGRKAMMAYADEEYDLLCAEYGYTKSGPDPSPSSTPDPIPEGAKLDKNGRLRDSRGRYIKIT